MDESAGAGRRLHPLSLVVGPLQALRGWVAPLAIAVAVGGIGGLGRQLGGLLIFVIPFALGLVGQLVWILRLRYRLTGTDLHLRTGVLQVQERTIPFERIQNVNLSEPLVARIFGLASLTIETAGAAGADVRLSYVALPEAERLRTLLASSRQFPENSAVIGDDVLFEAPLSELLLAGATANRVGTLAAIVAAGFAYADDLGWSGDVFAWLERRAGVLGNSLVVVAAAAVLAALLVGWVTSIAATVARFYDFSLVRRGDDLHRSHGLLSRSSGLIPLRRVQLVLVKRPLVWRLLHRASLVASTAGSPGKPNTGVGLVAPIAPDGRIGGLVAQVMPDVVYDEIDLTPVSRLAIRRGFVRAALPGLLVFGAASFLDLRFLAGALAWALAAFAWARARYAALGYRLGDDATLTARAGVFTRSTWVVPEDKVQAVAVVSSLFQRRLGLSTVLVGTAGSGIGRISIVDVAHPTARHIADHLSMVSAATAFAGDAV